MTQNGVDRVHVAVLRVERELNRGGSVVLTTSIANVKGMPDNGALGIEPGSGVRMFMP